MPEMTMTSNAPAAPAQTTTGSATPPVKADVKTDVKAPATDTKTEVQKDAQVAEAIRKLKLVVDGQEVELDEGEVIKRAQKATAADKRFQEAAKIKRASEDLIRLLKTDPVRVLSHPSLGHNLRQMAEEYLYEKIQEDNLSPQEKELKELKEKMRMVEEEKKQRELTEQEKQAAFLRAKYEDAYTKDILSTLESSGLPKTPSTVRRLAYYMHEALARGVELKAIDVVDLVKEDYMAEIKDLIGPLDGEILYQILGDNVSKKLRNLDMAKLRRPGTPVNPKEIPASEERTQRSKKLSIDEWRERNRKILDGEE